MSPERAESEPAWTEPALADPHAVADKARRVERMFAAIATSYDLNNRLHSLGWDQAWRRAAVRLTDVRPGDVVVDVASGTGDLAMAFANPRSGLRSRPGAAAWASGSRIPPRRVLGIDFTEQMLVLARRKRPHLSTGSPAHDRGADARGFCPLSYCGGDALRLPVADERADVVSIAFGIRNVADPAAAMAEFYRVLRPAGRLMVLEFGLPVNRMLRAAYQFYFMRIMPRTAGWVARDRSGAYRYLPQSVNTFLDRPGMVRLIEDAGFSSITVKPLTFGIAVCYLGVK